MANALSRETSPYLLQHAGNPVDWLPWGEEAFARARREDKLVFLSIGYSTCHWCHVMEHESFENKDIAEVMNRHFINVKVDREERPDIDATYMAFLQATTGQGGWPLNVWLTPEALPVVGGTYFPPSSRYGRPGFPQICEQLATAFREDRTRVMDSASRVMEHLRKQAMAESTSPATPPDQPFTPFLETCATLFDPRHAGFGGAPKFPRPSLLTTLLQLHPHDTTSRAASFAIETLQAMRKGGIHDHLAGGFHRYSVDARWHIPHYEKMLYDQAQLGIAYTSAWQITHEPVFRQTAEAVLNYAVREMRDPCGAFHSAEDADSLPSSDSDHKLEGAFWTWTAEEIGRLLAPRDAALFSMAYGIMAEGNAAPESDPHGELIGRNTLYLACDSETLAETFSLSPAEVEASLHDSRTRLMSHRNLRPRPHRDDKIITAWNGLMISALAQAATTWGSETFASAAADAAHFLKNQLWDASRRQLYRSHRGKRGDAHAFPADYAFLIDGLIELHAARPSEGWLEWALQLQDAMDAHTWSDEHSGYVMRSEINGAPLLTIREDYDGAEPSPNHVAACNLLKINAITGLEYYSEKADRLIRAGSETLARQPFAAPVLLTAIDLRAHGIAHYQIPAEGYRGHLENLKHTHRPHAVFTQHSGGEILVCENQVCRKFP